MNEAIDPDIRRRHREQRRAERLRLLASGHERQRVLDALLGRR